MLSKDKRLSDHMLKLLVQLPRDFNLGPQQAWAMLRETMQQRLDGPNTASTSSGQLKHRNGSTNTCAVTPADVRAVIDKLKLNLRGFSSSSSITAGKAAVESANRITEATSNPEDQTESPPLKRNRRGKDQC